MGSVVTLGLGRLEVDWGKNWNFRNHSKLFLLEDRKPVSHYYFDEETEGIVEVQKPGFSRPFHSVKRRLELLGYSLTKARQHFERDKDSVPDFYEEPALTFDMFAKALASINVQAITLDPCLRITLWATLPQDQS